MNLAIVGGGPAGLRAAEVASQHGAQVDLYDAQSSVGKKFLVAGKGGLNLTKEEPVSLFASRYSASPNLPDLWNSLLADFDPEALRLWASSLGVETFVASTGRVYPKSLRAAPLLRRWILRLRDQGVRFHMRHRLVSLAPRQSHGFPLTFSTPGEPLTTNADAVLLALGGASWPHTGSDGRWVEMLRHFGIPVHDLVPANCGWERPWPTEFLAVAEGKPLKTLAVSAGSTSVRGELLVTRYGLEGGALYQLAPLLRAMDQPLISIDFKPNSSVSQLVAKMGPVRRNFLAEARQRWRLPDEVFALLSLLPTRNPRESAEALALEIKNFEIPLTKPRPIEEAISSAGGVALEALDQNLMLRNCPGVFVAGEMLDWEAPTGGYLLQGCFATGTRAARSALEWLQGAAPSLDQDI
ncbi:MAG: hypothetical protein RLZZ399_62 [Verrucomicrobiota bacterium]|jgi:uncharacterized flavoprotein (TIGR03862 family)